MIRILHSVSNMDRAGIETMLMNYYRNIDRNKIQFDFLCNKKDIGAYEEEIKLLGGRIFRTPGLNPLKFPQYVKYMDMLFNEHPEYKIVQGHNGAFAVYSLFCAQKNNIPIRIFHGHNSSLHNSALCFDLKYPLKVFCKRKILRVANKYWACGHSAAKFYFGDEIFDNRDYTVINNAIDLDKFSYNNVVREKIRKEFNIDGKDIIGHVGRFNVVKNHTFIVDVFNVYQEKNPNAMLVMIGDGEQKETIKEKVHSLNLDSKVLFVDNIPNVYEWYQAFDLFLMPSHNEGLPVVGIEAQAAGLPCVFSSGVPSEIAVTGNCRFISLSEPCSTWVKTVDSMISRKNSRIKVDDVITNAGYNIKNEAKQLEKMYFDLVNGIRGKR